jgi:hypothetical protein
MDNIGQEHDVLRRDLTCEQDTHPLLMRINQWEQESIDKIQTAAKSARTHLQQLLNKAKNNLKTSVNKMTEELQSSRESDDYTELNIKTWTNQLQELREMLDNPRTIDIDYENDTLSVIRLINVNDQQSSDSLAQTSQLHELSNRMSDDLDICVSERFVDIFGKITLSEGGLAATCSGGSSVGSSVGGIGRYSSGVHCIRFRIEQLSTDYFTFLGIINSSEQITTNIVKSTSCHGWRELDYAVVSGKKRKSSLNSTIRTGDELTLMIDCDNRKIQLEHHRLNRILDISVDLRLCAFPWKIVVLLDCKGDCIRILP